MSTTSTNLASLIPPEKIEERLRQVNLPPVIAPMIADVGNVGPGMGSTVSIVKMGDLTIPAGTTSENAEFPYVTSTDTDITVTDGLVGVNLQLSNKGQLDSIINGLAQRVALARKKIMLRIDQDGLDLIQSSSNTQNYTGSNLTEQRLLASSTTFAAQNPSASGPVAFVGTPQVISDLKADIIASGGTRLGGDAISQRTAEMMDTTIGATNGYQGHWNGVELFQTTQAPTTGTDCNASMVIAGPESAWAYRVWEGLYVATKWVQESASWLGTIYARYGWAIADDEQQLEVVLDNVA